MFLPARFALLSLLFSLSNGQRRKSGQDRPQGRTLGLLTPLLLGGGRPLFDVPLAAGPGIGSSSAAGGGGTQSDPLDSYYGGSYPSYGYRPNYGYGYPSYGYNYGYPGLAYGYGQNYYRPNYYNYAGYQRPQQYYGYRPNYSYLGASAGYPSNGGYGSSASISSSPASSAVGVGAGAGAIPGAGAGTSQLSTAQQAQLAGILGQALGSSLRPLLANGGGAGGATGAGANPQALSGLLSLLG
ncbi:pupal cuticle protein Edg-91 [Drosophila rhopaloa]|uniref:Pupal cuticle protein Edg-91 n=1 Tax=Drosophila rhopaloa TaxID=1041015 RepID=A0A6P4FMU7_DRORH|nr:pupal cuticle protein Edg-91 [Drosophila rhopaloa]